MKEDEDPKTGTWTCPCQRGTSKGNKEELIMDAGRKVACYFTEANGVR